MAVRGSWSARPPGITAGPAGQAVERLSPGVWNVWRRLAASGRRARARARPVAAPRVRCENQLIVLSRASVDVGEVVVELRIARSNCPHACGYRLAVGVAPIVGGVVAFRRWLAGVVFVFLHPVADEIP
eukprot:2484378-Prymnesium_polylepis.1